ncbi:MAG: M48 family metalloprotease [Pseudomonadota bacterium]
MLFKPLSLFLVYILTIFNFVILTLPFLIAIFPFIDIQQNQISFAKYIVFNPKLALLILVFIVSFLMLCYLLLDFIFGLSFRAALKGCQRYDKIKDYEFLEEIFQEARAKFSCKSVKLYIKDDPEINAFAVGTLSKKAIVLTSGLILHYARNTENNQQFALAIKSILGHEMSHLINKDFLPGLLIITNQKVTNFVSRILMLLFDIIIRINTCLGIHNKKIANIILTIYNIANAILTGFNRLIVYKIYEFISNFLSRSIEYRCDRQSAKAFGGINMAFALSLLGKSGYFTLFSTHPATIKRMKKVEIVEEKNAVIHPSFSSQISNCISILILPLICYEAAHLSKIDFIIKYYFYFYYPEFYAQMFNIYSWFAKLIHNQL